jgi:hypothetical protein
VNVDVALAKNFDRSAVAAVARDETGIFFGSIGACSGWTNQPEVLETIACREDMALASDLVLQKIRVGVACDCINAVKSINAMKIRLTQNQNRQA